MKKVYALDALGHEKTIFTRFKTSDHIHKLPATFIITLQSALLTVSETTKTSKRSSTSFNANIASTTIFLENIMHLILWAKEHNPDVIFLSTNFPCILLPLSL